MLGEDGTFARVVKYIRLTQVPQQATLRLYGFGISIDDLYVNGVAVAPDTGGHVHRHAPGWRRLGRAWLRARGR